MPITTIRTEGKADIGETIIFNSRFKIHVGDEVDLKVSKPKDAPIYGKAKVSSYTSVGNLRRWISVRIN